jgi:hypothetical protein
MRIILSRVGVVVRLALAVGMTAGTGCSAFAPIGSERHREYRRLGDAEVDAEMDRGGQADADPGDDAQAPGTTRVLFVLDTSESTLSTDPGHQRVAAFSQVVEELRGDPGARFGCVFLTDGVVPCNWRPSDPDPFFTTADDVLGRDDPIYLMGAGYSDYQSALVGTRELLAQDMAAIDAEQLREIHYRVIFISDGKPEPRCDEGCEDDALYCLDGADNDGDGSVDDDDPDCADPLPDDRYRAFCNDAIELPELPAASFPARGGPCSSYNTDEQILAEVDRIVGLADRFGAASVTFDTMLVFGSQNEANARCDRDVYCWWEGMPLLEAMAEAGGGTFSEPFAPDREPAGTSCGSELGPSEECDPTYEDCGPTRCSFSWGDDCSPEYLSPDSVEECEHSRSDCERSCAARGGRWIDSGDDWFCDCPGPGGGCVADRDPRASCVRPSGIWHETEDGEGWCQCHPSRVFVSYTGTCLWPEDLERSCLREGGVFLGADQYPHCLCPYRTVFVDGWSGNCADADAVASVCEATSGLWSIDGSTWSCECPDGRLSADGSCS